MQAMMLQLPVGIPEENTERLLATGQHRAMGIVVIILIVQGMRVHHEPSEGSLSQSMGRHICAAGRIGGWPMEMADSLEAVAQGRMTGLLVLGADMPVGDPHLSSCLTRTPAVRQGKPWTEHGAVQRL